MRQILALAILVSSLATWPQIAASQIAAGPKQSRAGNNSSVSISGHVFLITESGDLKPARFANVYLMSDASSKNGDAESATTVFLKKHTAEMESRSDVLRREIDKRSSSGVPGTDSEESECLTQLLIVTDSVEAAVAWAAENHQDHQIVSTETNEDGVFQISGIVLDDHNGRPLGSVNRKTKADGASWDYTLIVQGRAGANEAYWESHVGFLRTNGETAWRVGTGDFQRGRIMSVKLVSPEQSCLVLSR